MWPKREKKYQAFNHLKLQSTSEEQCRYAFVDSKEHHADRIIMGALIPVVFEKMGPDCPANDSFELRICAFNSRYESWFLCCMADLDWVLQVEGDYAGACEQVLGASVIIREELKNLKNANAAEAAKPGLPRLGLKPAV